MTSSPDWDARMAPERLARIHTDDPWAKRRAEDPVLRGIMRVLIAHPEVSFYVVDWRPWLFGACCPLEERMLATGVLESDPADICGSHRIPYDEGGGGYLERFASDLDVRDGEAVSAALLRDLRTGYDMECHACARRNTQAARWQRTWYGGPVEPKMTFEQILAFAGWTPKVLAEIDAAVDDERVTLNGGQLELALGWAA